MVMGSVKDPYLSGKEETGGYYGTSNTIRQVFSSV
jgi:hypothetical protein